MTGALVSLAAVMAVLLGQASTPATATYTYNLYVTQAVKFQNPNLQACTAADTMTMLNLIYYTHARARYARTTAALAQPELRWKPTITATAQKTIYTWERSHMSQPLWSPGVDGHGWRNALNFYGWGDFTDSTDFHYADLSYGSFDAAVKAAV